LSSYSPISKRSLRRTYLGRVACFAPVLVLLMLLLLLTLSGCAGYQFGNHTLFPAEVHTVSVQMFTSDSFRPNLGERLTEAVIKEVENRTQYKVVSSTRADSVLSGHLINDAKRGVMESPDDGLRDIEVAFYVQINWQTRGGAMTPLGQPVPMAPVLVNLSQSTHFAPEVGGSMAVAQQKAIERLAALIVDQMESPW